MIRSVCGMIGLPLVLAGCMVGPDYSPRPAEVPQRWSGDAARGPGQVSRHVSDWWRNFDDPVLNTLIAQAAGFNLDLKQAKERIVQARTQRVVAIAAGLPLIDAHGFANRRQNNFTGQTGGSVIGTTGGFGLSSQHIDIFQLGFDVSWELDLFGGIRRSVEAADAEIEVEVENTRDVLVTLLGEVALNYLELRLAQRQLAITQENLAAQRDTLELSRHRNNAGLTSELDVAQAASQVASTEAEVPQYEARMQVAIHALGVLLGRKPNDLQALLAGDRAIPVTTPRILRELPSELLRRRPDLRRAERQLAAATARVGVATAGLYPRLNLADFLGFQNNDPTDFTLLGKSWSVGATLTAPLVNWGRNMANLEARESEERQQFLAYQSTVLNALREVEDALVQYATEQRRVESLRRALESDRLAFKLAEERYLRGLADFLNVLVAQRTLLTTQSRLADSTAQVSANLVSLYKALGGGWQIDPTLAVVPENPPIRPW